MELTLLPRIILEIDVKNGHRLVDPSGVDCPSDKDARQQGEAVARQIAADAPKSIARKVAVIDNEGREIANVPIGEAKVTFRNN